ncbi:MAG TPA: Ig-like domain-containing protein [Sedimentisphaerales bacterium]|jgi:hypothetical protein|nr:cadherin-like domain-containing protein [Phycisphaerae bacterium]HOC61819.1 Ig-like domain-containing protein [Sedimentisphaerales bacterium]HPY50255.1 Ig-like domain-containing protein [Sedimentisphaerales bacterium]HQA90193.1 Ig-like domain-containing protein [Sedimentisphaerales bacterium]
MTGSKVARKSGWLGVSLVAVLLVAASASVSEAIEIGTGETYDRLDVGPDKVIAYAGSDATELSDNPTYSAESVYAFGGGTVNLAPSGRITRRLYVQGGDAYITGGSVGNGISFTSGTVTVYGTDFAVTTGTIADGQWTPVGGSGTLTGSYEDDSPISLLFYSNIAINLLPPGGTPPANSPPEAYGDSASTTINTSVTIDVLDNDEDPEDDPLTISGVSDPANGTATTDGAVVTYTSDADFVGIDAFTYTISDGNGGTASATVTVTVNSGSIDIDIRPGSESNRIYVWCPRFIPVVIPVAIFSTEGFDATALDPAKIFLAGAGVLQICGWGDRYLSTEFDVNDDGRLDLLVVVTMDPEDLDPDPFPGGTAYLRVHAAAFPTSPVLYEGSDHIEIVKLY